MTVLNYSGMLVVMMASLSCLAFFGIHNAEAMMLSDDGTSCSSIGAWQASTNTCVLRGNVTGGIEIMANGITIDGNGHSVIGNQTASTPQDYPPYQVNQITSGILIDTKYGISIRNLEIEGFQYGIHIMNGMNINLIGNTIHSNANEGLSVSNSKQVMVTDNHFVHNSYGMVNQSTDFTKNYVTIFIDRSQDYVISQNIFSDNGGNVVAIWNADGESITGNTIQGGNLKWVDKSGILLINGTNVTVSGNNVNNVDEGVVIQNSDHCIISKNNLSQNRFGIMLNTAMTGANVVTNNLVQNNTIFNNSDDGIYLVASRVNTIVNNVIDSSGARGIELFGSTENKIYNNDFVNNIKQVEGGSGNLFVDGVKGGNYWSDYSPNCTDANNDGVCDKPYPFNGGTVGVTDNSVWVKKDGWKYLPLPQSSATPPVIAPPANNQLPIPVQSTTTSLANATSAKIPHWVKTVFNLYGQGQVSDNDLISALKFLIQTGVIKVS